MNKTKRILHNPRLSRLWDEYYSYCESTYGFDEQDAVVFEQFIILQDIINTSLDEQSNNGVFYESVDAAGKLLIKANPANKTLADCQRQLIAYYIRYGLSEYDRKVNARRTTPTTEATIQDDLNKKFADC